MIKELKFPIIYNKNIKTGYGGNQEWFGQNWKRQAGCGSTSGANLVAYYATVDTSLAKLYKGNSISFNQIEYVQVMDEMFTYMKPNIFGYPYIHKFSEQFVKFCGEHGVKMEARIIKKYRSTEEAFQFVKEQIDAGQPIALLVLFHRARQLKDDNWHWMTITGYIEDNEKNITQIIRSNYGKREIVDAKVLFEIHNRNIVRMASFHIINEN
ncbi:MAG: hypothetical protein K0S01_1355 [Herbinix sp.]|jgi:hypothetical protein|nr:hypothetical protein [Herbinix sp.]